MASTRDSFTHVLGNRRGSDDAVVLPQSSPETRARQLVRQLTDAPATARTSTPAERLFEALRGFELAASELGTRPATHGLLLVWELHGRFSDREASESVWRGLLVWSERAGWELFERAVTVGVSETATPAS
jgi:hypothetical protein